MQPLSDAEWIRQSFMLPESAISSQDQQRRTMSDARFNFYDTTLGGNLAINAPPQWCEYADIRSATRNPESKGMGRYYYEAIENNSQLIHMRFGVPSYNSLANFFLNFYNLEASVLARTGRTGGFFMKVASAFGSILSLPLQPIIWANQVFSFLVNKPTSKYYYSKPTMPLYWKAVNNIANAIGVNMGIIPRPFTDDEKAVTGDNLEYSRDDILMYHQMIPSIFRAEGGVDVYRMASRAMQLNIANRDAAKRLLESNMSKEELRAALFENQTGPVSLEETPLVFEKYLERYDSYSRGESLGESDSETTGDHFEFLNGIASQASAEWANGSEFVTFRVDHTGEASESFSNEVGESDLANKINSISAGSRETRFSMAEGNIDGGLFSGIVKAATDTIAGISAGIGIDGAAVAFGSALVDIPQTWKGSTASMPGSSTSYNIELRSPYGDPLSRFQNLIIPLAMLLAAALPRSTGRQSYTAPFLCELYSKGRTQTRLGMVTDMSITRGAGNIGWTKDHEPLGIDVSFTVKDMSTIMHMPIKPNFTALQGVNTAIAEGVGSMVGTFGFARLFTNDGGDTGGEIGKAIAAAVDSSTFDDDNAFSDYMGVLGSLGLADQVMGWRKAALRTAQRNAAFESTIFGGSPSSAVNTIMGTKVARFARQISMSTGGQF